MQSHKKTSFSPECFARAPKSLLQRRCACGNHTIAGGECDECGKMKRFGLQTKLKVNEPGDIYEQEADRIADQVMAAPRHFAVSGAPPLIRRFSRQSNRLNAAPASVDQVLANPGRPLEPAIRQDMGQRIRHDFSQVRVHCGAAAEQSARDLNAHAYTVGHDIVFGAGRFMPGTNEGRRLIAHELTHVAQQCNGIGSEPTIQRMKKGTGTVKKETGEGISVLKPPPPEHEHRIDAVIERIRRIAEDPDTYSACHGLFKKHCSGCKAEGLSSLDAVFKKAVIWFDETGVGLGEGAWAHNCDPDIAYTKDGYAILGEEALAGAIIHEMGHVCGISGDSRHHLADRIRLGCISGAPTLISVRAWNDPAAVVFGFRSTLKNWLGGQYALRGGLDLDLAGLGGADFPAQLGSALLRFEARAPLWWGGERWGGSSLFTELGAGVGRFRVHEPAPGDPDLALHGGVIIGLGTRLEWYLPYGKVGRRYPIGLTATYQTMIPLTHDAKRFQSVLIGIETWFGN